jgi:hemoglobin
MGRALGGGGTGAPEGARGAPRVGPSGAGTTQRTAERRRMERLLGMTNEALGTSLYDRLGGEPTLIAAMDRFYDKVLKDPLVSPFFEGMDMAAQRSKGVAFLSTVMGGPDVYRGLDMRKAHARIVARGMGEQHFDAIISHLRATLHELGANPADAAEAVGLAEGARDEVLNR